jgi:hypothetical protein
MNLDKRYAYRNLVGKPSGEFHFETKDIEDWLTEADFEDDRFWTASSRPYLQDSELVILMFLGPVATVLVSESASQSLS